MIGSSRLLDHCNNNQLTISPCVDWVTQTAGLKGIKQTIAIRNSSQYESQSVTITCSVTGAVTGCRTFSLSGQPSTSGSIVVPRNSAKSIDFYYDVSTVPGKGTFKFAYGALWGVDSVTVVGRPTSPPLHLLSVAPSFSTVEPDSSAVSMPVTFQLAERGNDSASYDYSVTCTGTAFSSGCTPASGRVLLQPNQAQALTVSFGTAAPVGSKGTLKLLAWRVADATVRDSALVSVTVSRGTPGVSVATVNPGSMLERSLCLNASVAPGAAFECGGLRLVAGLPGVLTRNKARAPTLLYQSQDAHPRPVVLAEVTLPDAQIPQ